MTRIYFILVFFAISVKFSFGQFGIQIKDNFGIEIAYSSIYNHLEFKEESAVFTVGKIKYIFNLKYRRQYYKNFSLNMVGNYHHLIRQGEIDKIDDHLITYDFKLSYKQVSLLLLPEVHIGRKFEFFIQTGFGIGYKFFNEIQDSKLLVSDLDGNNTIENELPELDGTHIIYKFSFGTGFRLNFEKYSLDLGYRYIKDSTIILNEKYYNMLANNSDLYIGFYLKL